MIKLTVLYFLFLIWLLMCEFPGLVIIYLSVDIFIYYCSVFFVGYPYYPTFRLSDLVLSHIRSDNWGCTVFLNASRKRYTPAVDRRLV